MIYLNPTARPYAAAILAVGTEHPTAEDRAFIAALSLDRVARHHVAFAAYIRRIAAGEQPDTLGAYLEPAKERGELPAALAAVEWLRALGESQRLFNRMGMH